MNGADRVAPDKASPALAFRVTLCGRPAEARMRPTISLNEMRERVAELIFGDDWIRTLTDEEYELLNKYRFEPRFVDRADGSSVQLYHVKPYPRHLAAKIDRARGRAFRLDAQWVTIDTWLWDHHLPVDPRRGAERKRFNAIVRAEARNAKSAPKIEQRRPGPKAKVLPRVMAEMERDISNKRLSPDDLAAMPDKELETNYRARRWSVRVARRRMLDKRKKTISAK
jgi:hypothetical protein